MGITEIFDVLHNETQYRTKRIADFWEPKIRPIVNTLAPKTNLPSNGLTRVANAIADPSQRPQIDGITPKLPSEMLEEGVGMIAAPLLSSASKALQSIGVDERIANFGIPLIGVATSMRPTSWSKGVKSLKKNPKAIQKYLSKPYHKSLQGTRFEHMTIEDLSNNKGGWLDILSERDSQFSSNHANYMKNKSASSQRKMYDEFTDNPLSNSRQVYDNNMLRKAITKSFNQVTGKEWHHVFGNKEAAETMLTTIAQDPYIAVNLFHHMQKLKLPVSGKADNIALMSKASHRKKGGLHSYQKKLGIENTGRKKGILELNDFAAEISNSVLKGETDVTELFTLIEKYAQLNRQHLKPKIKNEFGGKMLNELKGMEAFIQGQ
tara:strand:+ start:42 stop:1175 length:1134 start_codon:yes stop_codon:yes gene_type:complete